jgi:hypothetical protein
VDDDPDTTLQWRLRYSPESVTPNDMLVAASFLNAYAYLTDPSLTVKQAVASLRRARTARASTPTETE